MNTINAFDRLLIPKSFLEKEGPEVAILLAYLIEQFQESLNLHSVKDNTFHFNVSKEAPNIGFTNKQIFIALGRLQQLGIIELNNDTVNSITINKTNLKEHFK